ncbi:hypothetical protein Tco_0606452 [Tanacetum coccineum]
MSLRIFVLRLHRVKRLQKFFILGLVVKSSTSDYVKCKSRIDTACDRHLNSPQSANCGRFGMVAQRDLETISSDSPRLNVRQEVLPSRLSQSHEIAFPKGAQPYWCVCSESRKRRERNTASEESTAKRVCQSDPNVVSSQVVSNKSLRLDLSQEVIPSTLLQSPGIAFPASADVNTGCSSPFITKGSGRISVSVSHTCKRRQRNVASEESRSKRVCQSAPKVRNRRPTVATRQDGEGCSSAQTRVVFLLMFCSLITVAVKSKKIIKREVLDNVSNRVSERIHESSRSHSSRSFVTQSPTKEEDVSYQALEQNPRAAPMLLQLYKVRVLEPGHGIRANMDINDIEYFDRNMTHHTMKELGREMCICFSLLSR